MREIKFRAWDRLTKKFNKIKDLITIDGSVQAVRFAHFADGKDFQGIDYVNLQQYTGLKDCKGVEIYEGDIIRLIGIDISGSRTTEVIFTSGSFREKYMGYALEIYKTHEIEVIGNIYENPELLKEGE